MKEQEMMSLPEGYKMTELGPLPEEWEVVRLGDMLEILRNGTTKKQNKVGKGLPVSRIETISTSKINPQKVGYIEGLTDEEIEKYKLIEGDILFSHINSEPYLGNSAIYENEPKILIHGMNLLMLRTKPNKLNSRFLNYLFNLYRQKGIFVGVASRAVNQSSINQGKLKLLNIPLPPLSEQKKIAAVLSAVQEAKEKTEEVIKATKELKKSLMKYLFTYGPVPVEEAEKVKLKKTEIGEIPEEWELVKLGEVAKLVRGISWGKKDEDPNGTPVVAIPNVRNGKVSFDIRYKIAKSISDSKKLNEDDILLVGSSGSVHNVGRTAVVKGLPFKEATFASFLIKAIPTSIIYKQFLFYLFGSPIVDFPSCSKRAADGKYNLQLRQLSEHQIPLPPLSEQKKIASILSAVDEKIQAEEDKKKALEDLFKTLLHDLMTAKIRVNHLEIEA